MTTFDNTPLVEAVHSILFTSGQVVEKLKRDARPESQETVNNVTTMLNLQSDVIRKLLEHNLNLTDTLESITEKLGI